MMCFNLAKEILANPSVHTPAEVIAAMRFLAGKWVVRS